MFESILAVGCAVPHSAEQLDEFRMKVVDADFERGVLAILPHLGFDLFSGLFDHLLDPGRMNTAVDDEFFKGDPCDLSSDRVET